MPDPAPPSRTTAAVPNAPATTSREFPFEQTHFDFIARLIRQLAGIALARHKTEMVYARLSRRLRELGLADFDAYCGLLDSPEGAGEVGFLVNALTTNLTSFFRERHHFDHLARTALPEAITRRMDGGPARLRLWSAGCSSGQEPYTIAMVVATTVPDLRHWDARILATDIDTHMVETARRGTYPSDTAADIPAALRERFTRRERGGASIHMGEEIRRLVAFKPLNLLEPWPMKGPFDAIFCRNVLIYFDRVGRTQVIEGFARMLRPDGHLYLGHSESLYGLSALFRPTGPTTYRRL